MSLPVIVLGGGGHARVLIDALLLQSVTVLGYTDADPKRNYLIQGIPNVGEDEFILSYSPTEIQLVNAIGSIHSTKNRRKLYEAFKSKGYSFAAVIHPSAIVAKDSKLGEGVQIMAGAIIQAGSQIGANTIINTRASIDHDCSIGSHVHIAPGVTLSGGVQIGDHVHIGTGATVIQQIHIHENSLVGAGALVLQDVSPGCTVYGVPAKEVKQ